MYMHLHLLVWFSHNQGKSSNYLILCFCCHGFTQFTVRSHCQEVQKHGKEISFFLYLVSEIPR